MAPSGNPFGGSTGGSPSEPAHTARLNLNLTLPAPIDRVWSAWSTPAGWNSWFTSGADFTLAEGETYRTADGDTGRFLRIIPGRLIAFTWEHPKHPPGSSVEVTLTPAGPHACALTLTHGPFPDAARAAELQSAWTNILKALAHHSAAP